MPSFQIGISKTAEGQERIKRAKARIESGKRPRAHQAEGEQRGVAQGGAEAEVAEVPMLQDRAPADAEMASEEATGVPLSDMRPEAVLTEREEVRDMESSKRPRLCVIK